MYFLMFLLILLLQEPLFFCFSFVFPQVMALRTASKIYVNFDFYRFHSSTLAHFSCTPDMREEHMPRIAMGICKSTIYCPFIMHSLSLFFLVSIFSCTDFSVTVLSIGKS